MADKSTYDPSEADLEGLDTSTGTLFKKAFQRFRHEMLPPGNPLTVFGGHAAQAEDTTARQQRGAEVAEYKDNLANDRYGLRGQLIDAVPMALATAPLGAGLGNVATKGFGQLPGLGRITSRIAGEGVANAALGAGEAVLEGKDAGTGAVWGGIGGSLGAGLASGVGGAMKYLSPKISDSARELLQRGYQPSPGQLSEGGILSTIENMAGRNPLLTEKVVRAQGSAAAQNFGERLGAAADRIGANVEGTGKPAVKKLIDEVDEVYKAGRAGTFGRTADVKTAFRAAETKADLLAGDNEATRKALKSVIEEARGQLGGTSKVYKDLNFKLYSGDRLRDMDIWLGDAIKNARKSKDSLKTQVLEELQLSLREATTGKDDATRELLNKANATRRDLFGLEKAVKGTKATGGMPSGEKLDEALRANKQPGEAALAAVDKGVRARPNGLMTVAGFLHSPLASTAAATLGGVMYTPGGIRATTNLLRGAGALRSAYGKTVKGAPGAFTRSLGRTAGRRVGEAGEEDYSQYE